ncbi:twin-arginine translocase TatA/TatE family subunit [Pseudoroseomonas ludipueritiae]|uniref:Sec-independent protein translocase protein TatA n=1 Tax=Pseudoroseomonas ludipueritiae TaxID=198093 RepID=A0ABR7REL9_9PROT|nr:twin-arginine translocase TatA/TatE family subunit [Pseudoroseomonas ludipueritiae]MBC9180245.1 twin-arginine translocase TatA/TatE family subunit [Pseudoroseomonas ludipueritiae]MCG7362565.1 twin-arginine translocase TatA/TatE family subunit [Roseomonas sp. ACRSG]
MGSFSIWHWMVVLLVVLLLFGGGSKISGLMGDFAKGIKSFKKNMNESDDASMAAEATPPTTPAGNLQGPTTVPPTQAAPQQTTNRPAA